MGGVVRARSIARPLRPCDGAMHMGSIGANVKHLLERPDERHCFRLHKDRVYYVR